MDGSVFYPAMRRRDDYKRKIDGSYYAYDAYRGEIQEDCLERCVYCDIKGKEIGYEGFVLDHFRPQKHFPELAGEPNNLVLSCPKCNRLKSDKWPIQKEKGCAWEGKIGFLDPFADARGEYFQIEADGSLTAKKGPAEYVIKLLALNRVARKLLRRRRILMHAAVKSHEEILQRMNESEALFRSGKIAQAEFLEAYQMDLSLLRILQRIFAE